MAYKRELIINNGSLTSYKKLLKVSDVCQLLDKRTFKTRTGGGTTAAYNNDGTFTVSGTATVNNWKNFPIFQLLPGGGEHVYLFNVVGSSEDTNCDCNIYFYDEITDRAVVLMTTGREGSAVIKKLETPIAYQARFNITTLTGATPNNIVYKPQLFDLTEMYGAGNEPATVDEFKAKFPNELYPYSPRCWVKSYKTGLIAKTKNLLDYNKFNMLGKANYIINSSTGTIIRPQKTSFNNSLFYPMQGADAQLSSVANLLQLQGTYTFSFKQSDSNILIRKYKADGTVDDTFPFTTIDISKYSKTITFDTLSYIDLKIEHNQPCHIIGLQIEKGSTATDYVPYGYL